LVLASNSAFANDSRGFSTPTTTKTTIAAAIPKILALRIRAKITALFQFVPHDRRGREESGPLQPFDDTYCCCPHRPVPCYRGRKSGNDRHDCGEILISRGPEAARFFGGFKIPGRPTVDVVKASHVDLCPASAERLPVRIKGGKTLLA
jgi:hypothetical protein